MSGTLNTGYPCVPLSKLCDRISSGGTPSRRRPDYFTDHDGHPWVKSQELLDGSIWTTSEHISDLGLANSSAKYYPQDTVLMAMYGANVGQLGYLRAPATVNQAICGLCADSSIADSRYIFYALMQGRQPLIGQAAGAAQQNLNQDLIRNFEIPVPPLPVQRKIAVILSAYDDLIENNNLRIKLTEEMAQRIYREWFVDFRYPGHENVPLVDSELGPIPQGWPVGSLSDAVGTQYGYTESAKTAAVGPRFLRGMDINKTSYIDWSTVPYCPINSADHEKYRLSVGDVVVIRMADPGKVGIAEVDVDAVFASYLIRVRPLSGLVQPYFLFYFMASERYQAFVTGASTGTTRKSLSAPLITSVTLAFPPADIQRMFVDCVTPLRCLLTQLLKTNAALRSTRDLLLPRLISGEVDVTDLDIAEAAA